MEKPLGVVEPIDRRHRETRFSFFGIPVSFTDYSWLSWPITFLAGLPIALLEKRDGSKWEVAKRAWRHHSIMSFTNYIHSLGHIVSGKLAGAPMDELVITATRHITLYKGDQSEHPPKTHIMRAAGGPVMNALVGLVVFAIWRLLGGKHPLIRDFAIANGLTALAALAPVESVDGRSILEHLPER